MCDYMITKKNNNLIKVINILENNQCLTTGEIADNVGVSVKSVYSYIQTLRKMGLDIITSDNPRRYSIDSQYNVESVKSMLGNNIDNRYSLEGIDKSSKAYVQHLFKKIGFEKKSKIEAIKYVKSNSLASLYEIYNTYYELRSEYVLGSAF